MSKGKNREQRLVLGLIQTLLWKNFLVKDLPKREPWETQILRFKPAFSGLAEKAGDHNGPTSDDTDVQTGNET